MTDATEQNVTKLKDQLSAEEADFLPLRQASDLDKEMAGDDMKDLVSQLGRDAKGWNPENEPTIFGKVLEITDSNEGEFGSYPIILIETPSKRLINIHCFHTILRNEVQRRMDRGLLTEGSLIAVQYLGLRAPSGGKEPANDYKIRVKRPVVG